MNRPRSLVTLVVLLATVAACSQAATTPASPSPSPADATPATSAAPSATAIPSAESPAASASPVEAGLVLGSDGSGPYVVGASMSDLLARNLITNVVASFHCDDSWQHADATGRYEGRLSVSFHLGSLIQVGSDSADLVTPDGAKVGMSIGDLEDIYGSRGEIIVGTMLNQAFVVPEPDGALGLLFYLDDTNTKARAVSAGDFETLEAFVMNGEGC